MSDLCKLYQKYGKELEPTLLSFMTVEPPGGQGPSWSVKAPFLKSMRVFEYDSPERRKQRTKGLLLDKCV